MYYEMKHFDTPLLRFSVEGSAEPKVRLLWINEEKRDLLPLDLEEVSDRGIVSWVLHRSVPKNRAYVENLLSRMGLSSNRPFDVLRVSRGLSLNDCYWVTEEGYDKSFAERNLYQNRFSRTLGEIAFAGYGSGKNPLSSSPEFTTNGMLPKCWRRENGVIRLYKGGTEGASNTGNEPYSEYYAAQIAETMGVNAIPYDLTVWKGKLCSTCRLFTGAETSFVPVGRIVREGGMRAVRNYYEKLGKPFVQALDDMIVLDAVIFNTDRHYGNFGFLLESKNNRIIKPAPLFDHGNSLMNLAGRDALASKDAMLRYAKTLKPSVYDDFVSEAKSVMTNRHREMLRKLLNFRFAEHSRYNLPKKRLKLLEQAVSHRAEELLG